MNCFTYVCMHRQITNHLDPLDPLDPVEVSIHILNLFYYLLHDKLPPNNGFTSILFMLWTDKCNLCNYIPCE